MAQGLREIAALPDPVGAVVDAWRRPSGIEISRVRVPLGVIGFIYESRPNVTADAAGLCMKSGNAVILRGRQRGHRVQRPHRGHPGQAAEKAGGPAGAIQFVDTTDREAVGALLTLDGLVDLVIPRGGEEFVRWVAQHSASARAQARQGAGPRVRRCRCRLRHGDRHRHERQGPASERLQCARDLARTRDVAAPPAPRPRCAPGRGGGRGPGLPRDTTRAAPARGRPPRPTGTRSIST